MERNIKFTDFSVYKNNFPVLLKCNFEIEQGLFYVITGNNGAGKSSLLKEIEKKYRMKNQSVCSLYTEKIFEPHTSINQINIFINAPEFLNLLSDFFKTEDFSKSFKDFSSGQQQIITLCALVATKPQVLILDEPFDHIDENNSNLIADHLLELQENGSTIFLATHYVPKALKKNVQNVVMRGGSVVETKQPKVSTPKANETELESHKLNIYKYEVYNFIKSGITLKFLLPLLLSILILGAFTSNPDDQNFSSISTTIIWLAIIASTIALLPFTNSRKNLYIQIGVKPEKTFALLVIYNSVVTLVVTMFGFGSAGILFNQKIDNPILAIGVVTLAGIGLGVSITIVALITKSYINVGALLLLGLIAPLSMGVIRSWESTLENIVQTKNWFVFLLAFILILCSVSVAFAKELVNND
jgi:ABC-2 type transport system ATP-binding protein